MTPRRRLHKTGHGTVSAATSWMALLAATTLGWDGRTLRARVCADDTLGLDDAATYGLMVQSYEGRSMEAGAHPVGSLQRFVSGAELRRGIDVNLIELRALASDRGPDAVVVAWITSATSLEMDGRAARPEPGQVFGRARTRAAGDVRPVRIALSRKMAA